jgi:hypothetical protein
MPLALVRPDILYGWRGPSLLVVNTRGDCGEGHALTGFYHREARFLRTLRFEINGRPPWLCEAALIAPDTLLFNFVYPEITISAFALAMAATGVTAWRRRAA